ncbi:hypothetical protein [Streptomyces sp. NPDC002265]|uniref:hypothetical protein n=1 Tax=Streptomyces sp. NPDC002265 TaxID=3154415 RepID=UPI00332CB1EE
MTPHQAFRPLLHALALAQGRGLPVRDGIWSTIAAASAPQETAIIDRAISDLTAEATPYLMLDTEAEQTVYRLAHRPFTEHFAQFGQEHERLHQVITAALTTDAACPKPNSTRTSRSTSPPTPAFRVIQRPGVTNLRSDLHGHG